jgi:hypothetical protein
MWTDYFRFTKLRRGRVITPSHGEIDFSADNIGIETCKELYETGFPYMELTELGKKVLYGIGKKHTLSKRQGTPKRKKLERSGLFL